MDTRTGEIIPANKVPVEYTWQFQNQFVEVDRKLTEKEKSELRIRLYSLCGCGSGKKFKFCCYKKPGERK